MIIMFNFYWRLSEKHIFWDISDSKMYTIWRCTTFYLKNVLRIILFYIFSDSLIVKKISSGNINPDLFPLNDLHDVHPTALLPFFTSYVWARTMGWGDVICSGDVVIGDVIAIKLMYEGYAFMLARLDMIPTEISPGRQGKFNKTLKSVLPNSPTSDWLSIFHFNSSQQM